MTEEKNLDVLKSLELERLLLEAKFAKARNTYWRKSDSAWDIFDDKLEAIWLEQKKGIEAEDTEKKEWDAERLSYVESFNKNNNYQIKYNSKADDAFDVLDSKLSNLLDKITEAFDSFLFDEEDLVLKITKLGFSENFQLQFERLKKAKKETTSEAKKS